MRLLDRYIVRETIGPFLLALCVFTFVLAVRPMLEHAELLLAKGVPLRTVSFLLLTLLPQALGLTLPMAFLAGCLMALSRLSGDRETVALLACGVNPIQLLRPVLILAAAIAGLTLYLTLDLQPHSNRKFREMAAQFVRQTAEADIKPHMFYEGFPGKVLVVRETRTDGGWDGIFLADTTHPDRVSVLTAERGRLVLDQERLVVNLVLNEVMNYVPSDEPGLYTVGASQASTLQIDPRSILSEPSQFGRGFGEMTMAELREQWDDKVAAAAELQAQIEDAGTADHERALLAEQISTLSPHNEIMYLHQKFSIPAACLVFGLLAVPLGFHTRKEGKLAGLTVGLLVIFLYHACKEFGEAGAKSSTHWFDPHWARWFPNLVLGGLGVLGLWWRCRATGQTLSFPWPARLSRGKSGPARPMNLLSSRRRVVVVIRFPRVALPRPHLLDVYVSQRFLRVGVLALLALMGLYYIGTVVDLSERLFKGQATGWLLLEFLWYATPRFVYYAIPIATLIGVLGAIGGLTRSSELTVMRACGVSLYRTALPLIVLALTSGGLLFLLQERVLPHSNKKANGIEDTIRQRPQHTVNVENRNWLIGDGDRIYYYERFDSRRAQIHNLSVFEPAAKPYRLVREIRSARAACPGRVCADGTWRAGPGWEQRFDNAALPVRTTFVSRPVALNPFVDFTLAQVDASMMRFGELREYIRRTRASGFGITEEEVNLHAKLAFPLAAVVMTLLAVPCGVTTGRRGALYGVGLAVLLSIAYWLVMAVFVAAGKAGLLPAPLAAWATNILFCVVAGYLLLTVRT